MGYMLLLDNDAVDVYRHVEKTTRGGSVGTSPASANSKELPNKEEICLMARYDARLYTGKGVEILNTEIECTPENIPDMLASVVLDYLKDAPYPGVIKAGVTDGRCNMEYTLLLENNALHAYLHVKKAVGGGGAGTAPASPPAPRSFWTGRRRSDDPLRGPTLHK